MDTKVKIAIAIIVTSIVVGAVGTGLGIKYAMPSSEEAAAVRLETVARGLLIERVSAPGVIQPKTKVSISARIVARIDALPFKEGDVVTAGDPKANPPVPASVLVKLDSRDMEAQLRGAEARRAGQAAQIQVAEARIRAQEAQIQALHAVLSEAERDLKRQLDLRSSRDVAQSVVDQVQAKVDQQSAQLTAAAQNLEADRANLVVMRHELDAADAEIARARDALSYTTILSPLDGVVTRVNAKVGELVMTGTMNNPGTVIMEVADLNTMIVEAKVDESDVAGIKVGQPAEVRTQAYDEEVFQGVVDTIALAHSDDRTGSKYYKTEVLLTTGGRRIYSGLSSDVDVETERHESVIRVPSQAVVGRKVDELPQDLRGLPQVDPRKAFASVVYRMIDGKAAVTPVKVGPSDMTHTLIESGLNEGDLIIVGPYKVLESLKHDQKVKDERENKPATKPAA
jgi:HlyD family secretion protein